MDASTTWARLRNLTVGLISSLILSGCSMTRDSMLDQPTEMDPRVSVDDLADETSGFEAVPKTNKSSAFGGRANSNPRSKLAAWRDQNAGDSGSAPRVAANARQTAETDTEAGEFPESPESSVSSPRQSPFDRVIPNETLENEENASGSDTNGGEDESLATSDEANPFE